MGEEQQTFNALTNNELDECLEELIEHGFHASVFDVFSQAKETNRLREGLIRLKIDILAEELSGQSWPSMKTVERIRELSEEEE